MIKKINRLKENEIKKVLKNKKPFFSYNLIANYATNRLPYSRFGIFFSGKNCKTSISRNFYRRKFYDLVKDFIDKGSYDVVFIPKKGKIFDKKDELTIVEFEKDILFTCKKIFSNK